MLVTVFGGSGFIGRHVVKALAKRGHRVRVAVRRPDLASHVTLAGAIGQIGLVQANLRYPDSVKAACAGADVVINCVGLLSESGRQTFNAVQARGAETVANAARDAGAKLVHFSAIGASETSASNYAQTKAFAENAAGDAIILRPSLVFGPEDKLFNRFAGIATLSPVIPLVGAQTKFQPVYVGDVAEVTANAVDGMMAHGVYELGGPEIHTLRALIEQMLVIIGRKKLIIDLPLPIASLMGSVLQFAPGKPLTPDHVVMLQVDNVVTGQAVACNTYLSDVLPAYLWRYRVQGQFNQLATK
jgi:uncharacterized protein YbjT (DUF2867 family)